MKGKIRLCDDARSNTTDVSNIFIDNYMTHTPGEYVKVYIYLLRCMSSPGKSFSISSLSEIFSCSADEIRDALEYWEKADLMQLSFDADGSLREICISTNPPAISRIPESDAGDFEDRKNKTESPKVSLPPMKEYGAGDFKTEKESDIFSQLLFIIERYIGRPLSPSDVNYIMYWNKGLSMSEDLIVYLVETQIERSLTSVCAINSVACEWYTAGVVTPGDAKKYMASSSDKASLDDETVKTVISAFGITGRSLGSLEKEYAAKWSITWKFNPEMIAEACSRSLSKTGRSNFEYANRILENWYEQGVTDKASLEAADEIHKKEQEKKYKALRPVNASSKSSFKSNISDLSTAGRYDFDDIRKKLALR